MARSASIDVWKFFEVFSTFSILVGFSVASIILEVISETFANIELAIFSLVLQIPDIIPISLSLMFLKITISLEYFFRIFETSYLVDICSSILITLKSFSKVFKNSAKKFPEMPALFG